MVNRRANFLLKSMNDKIFHNLAEQRSAKDVDLRQQQNELLEKEQNVNVRQAENIRQNHLEQERSERQQLERQYYERIANMRTRQRGERVRS